MPLTVSSLQAPRTHNKLTLITHAHTRPHTMSATAVSRTRRFSDASNDIASYVFNHSRDDMASPAAPVFDETPAPTRRLSVSAADIAQYLGLWCNSADNADHGMSNLVSMGTASQPAARDKAHWMPESRCAGTGSNAGTCTDA